MSTKLQLENSRDLGQANLQSVLLLVIFLRKKSMCPESFQGEFQHENNYNFISLILS